MRRQARWRLHNESRTLMEEPLPTLPLIEVAGNKRVLIENHRGITAYGVQEIRAKVSYGSICITGSHLTLACISREKIVITGQIHCVKLCGGE